MSLKPATLAGLEALLSPGLDVFNNPLPPQFKVWIAPNDSPNSPVFFGSGTAVKTGPVNGIYTWSASITAALDSSIVPGSYKAYVYGFDGHSISSLIQNNDGYVNPDTANFQYPTLTADLTVVKADQTITFGPLAGKTYGAPDFSVSATSSSNLPVSFTASGNCTVSGSTVHITGAGSCTITAHQAGDDHYDAAPDVPQTFSIAKANATINVTPYSVTYDGNAHTATGTAKGVNNEDLSGLDVSGTTHTNAGTYGSDPWTFTDTTGNYNDASGTISDSIAKANATATAGSGSGSYNGSAQSPSACAVSGAYTAGLSCTNNPASAGPAVGTTTISPVVSGGVDNFNITLVNGSYTINAKQAAATADNGGGVYNGSAYTGSGTCSDGLTPAITYTPGPGAPVNVGAPAWESAQTRADALKTVTTLPGSPTTTAPSAGSRAAASLKAASAAASSPSRARTWPRCR